MWTPATRAEHNRDDLRYPTDLTDAEWQILAPLLPPPAKTGRHRSWQMRGVVLPQIRSSSISVQTNGSLWVQTDVSAH
jgi:transposase